MARCARRWTAARRPGSTSASGSPDNAGNIVGGQPDAPLGHQRQGRPPVLHRVRERPREDPVRPQERSSAAGCRFRPGGVAGRPADRGDLDGPEEGLGGPLVAGGALTDRHGRYSIPVPAARAAPTASCSPAPPARLATARGLSLNVPASSTIKSVTHASLQRPRSLLRPAAQPRPVRSFRLVGRAPGSRRREVAHVSDARARTQGPLARLATASADDPGGSAIRVCGSAAKPPLWSTRLLAQADNAGELRRANSAPTRPIAPDGSRSPRDRDCLAAARILPPASARAAATYDVWACTLPNGKPAPPGGWTADSGGEQRHRCQLVLLQ